MKERNFDQLLLAGLKLAHSSDWAYFLPLSLALSLSLSLPFSCSLSDELLWWAFAVVGLLLLEAVLGLALAVLLLVDVKFFTTAFFPELSDEEELELLTAILAAGFCLDSVLFAAEVDDLGSAGLFSLLVVTTMVVVGLAAVCLSAASSSELEEEEDAGGRLGDFSLRGLFPDDLGGCQDLFHLLPEGPGSGSLWVKTS